LFDGALRQSQIRLKLEKHIESPQIRQRCSEVRMLEAEVYASQATKSVWPAFWWRQLERALLFLLVSMFVARGVIPAWNRPNSDFVNYYLVARLYRQGYPVERVYDWIWLQRQKDHAGINKSLVGFTSTPTSILLVAPLSSLSPLWAARSWLVISLAFLLSTLWILKSTTQLGWKRVGIVTFLALAPLRQNVSSGQLDSVTLCLLALGFALFVRKCKLLSGMVLAGASAISLYPLLILLFFLIKKQWRAVSGLAFGMAGSVVLLIHCLGADACLYYWRHVLPWVVRGEMINPYNVGDSLTILLRRIFIGEQELNPAPVAHLPNVFALIDWIIKSLILVAFVVKSGPGGISPARKKLELSCVVFLALLLSPEPFTYQYVALTITAVLVVDYLLSLQQKRRALLVIILYIGACLPYDRVYGKNPVGWSNLLFFPRVLMMMMLAGVLFWILAPSPKEIVDHRARRRMWIMAGLAFVAMSATGSVLTMRHLNGQFDNYGRRVATQLGSGIATNPVANSDSVFYGALVPHFGPSKDTYTIRRLQAGSITSYGGNGDWFYPAVIESGDIAWAEVATDTGSSVVRFHPSVLEAQQPEVQAENAEQPIVSPNGSLLAFIREARGRGSLWTQRLDRETDGVLSNGEHQLVGAPYDVQDASFYSNHQVMFSSSHNRKFSLFTVDANTGEITDVPFVSCPARYPSVSPDGRWIAFSCDFDGYWQLVTMKTETGEQNQITSSDCNSIAPTWTPDSRSLIYATDCGRALGITALSELAIVR
jgi:hypothetical protein